MAFQIQSSCIRCGACLQECPTDAVLEGPRQYHIDSDVCMDDQGCVAVCPVNAIARLPELAREPSN